MYVRTGEGLGHIGMLYGQLSGPFGQDDLQQRIDKAIDAKRRANTLSDLLIDITISPFPKSVGLIVDFILMYNFTGHEDQVLTQLTKIHNDLYNADTSYRQRIDDEWNLRRDVARTTMALDPRAIKPFLLKVLVNRLFTVVGGHPTMSGDWSSVAHDFVTKMLPPALAQRIGRSKVASSQLANLASILQSFADGYRNSGKDAAFNRAVDAERKRILDAKTRQERLRQRTVPQRKKPKPQPKRKMTLRDI